MLYIFINCIAYILLLINCIIFQTVFIDFITFQYSNLYFSNLEFSIIFYIVRNIHFFILLPILLGIYLNNFLYGTESSPSNDDFDNELNSFFFHKYYFLHIFYKFIYPSFKNFYYIFNFYFLSKKINFLGKKVNFWKPIEKKTSYLGFFLKK